MPGRLKLSILLVAICGLLSLPLLAQSPGKVSGPAKVAVPAKDPGGTRETDRIKETSGAKDASDAKDARSDSDPSTKNARKKEAAKAITLEHEAAVLGFVKENYPELGDLLARLKQGHPKEYERAVRELLRATEQLAQLREHDPPRYELELKLWKVRSRIQLLSARHQMQPGDSLKSDLKAALAEQFDVQSDLTALELKQSSERVDRLEKQIAKRKASRDALLEQQFQTLTRTGKIADATKKPAAKSNERDASPAQKTSLPDSPTPPASTNPAR